MRLKKKHSQRGSALLMVVIVVLILVGISFAYMTISYINARKITQETDAAQALYTAESAVATKLNEWNTDWKLKGAAAARPATTNTVIAMNGGAYLIPQGSFIDFKNAIPADDNYVSMQIITWSPLAVDPVTNKWTTASQAFVDKLAAYYGTTPNGTNPPPPPNKDIVTRKIDCVVSRAGGGVYWNAVHAGNALKTTYMGAAYDLSFGGSGTLGDRIQGDIYSGGNVTAKSPATFTDSNGTVGSKNTTTAAGTASVDASVNSTTVSGSEPGLTLNRDVSGKTDWENAIAKFGSGNRDTTTGIAYIDVAADMAKSGSYGKWVEGSSATQITDVNNPSHIFRENPTSTGSSTARTQAYEYTYNGKNDFYLEDPTNLTTTHQSVSGVPVNGDTTASALNIQQNGNNAVYFVDGNLRVSGEPVKSYQLTPGAGVSNIKMTMVVKGNISMTDNVLYPTWQSKNDSLAMIAIQDPNFPNTTASDFQRSGSASLPAASGMTVDQFVKKYNDITQKGITNGSKGLDLLPTDVSTWTVQQQEMASQEYNKMYGSGNIYFGDPGSGTVEHFEAYLYAENNFYATNLDSTSSSGGTSKVEIFGNMTAGNQVRMVRNVSNTGSGGTTNYIPLDVLFDDAIKTGSSTPPGLPSTPSFGSGSWFVLGTRQAP